MASLFEGRMEMKASKNWTKAYGVLMRGKLDLYKDSTKGVLIHTVVFLPQTYYKEGKKKKEFSFSLITEKLNENHFKVDNKADRDQWRDYINLALKPEMYGTSRTLPSPSRKGGSQGFPPSMYSTEFQRTGQQGLYDDCATGRGVHFIDNRGNSPIDDSGIDSGGAQFGSRTSSVSDKGRSDDGVVRHLLPGNTSPFEKPRSAGNSPFTSPGSSADGTVTMLEKYQWFMGNISRDQADKILKEEPRSVFGLRYSKGSYVLSLRKLDGSGVLKQFHHRIVFKDSQYFIDGITTFSADSILGLLTCFVHHCPETPPLGGSLDALRQNPDEEDPAYDYAWEPDKMAGIIQQNLKLLSQKDDDDYVKLQEKLPAEVPLAPSKPKPPLPPSNKPSNATDKSKKKPLLPSTAPKPRMELTNELETRIGKNGPAPKEKPNVHSKGKPPQVQPAPKGKPPQVQPAPKGKLQHVQPAPKGKPHGVPPVQQDQLYQNHEIDEQSPIYGNVDFPDQKVYQNTEVKVTASGHTQIRPHLPERQLKQKKPVANQDPDDIYDNPAEEEENDDIYDNPAEEDVDDDTYVNPDGNVDEDIYMDPDAPDEDMYVAVDPEDDTTEDPYAQHKRQPLYPSVVHNSHKSPVRPPQWPPSHRHNPPHRNY